MLSIQVKEGDNIERALKQFKKKFDQTKTQKEKTLRKRHHRRGNRHQKNHHLLKEIPMSMIPTKRFFHLWIIPKIMIPFQKYVQRQRKRHIRHCPL